MINGRAGWTIGLPVPLMLACGPSWAWVIAANVLLGVNQDLTWSMTVNMKIDLIGPGRRGFALGINEAVGYLGVTVTALVTGYLATWYSWPHRIVTLDTIMCDLLDDLLDQGLIVWPNGHATLDVHDNWTLFTSAFWARAAYELRMSHSGRAKFATYFTRDRSARAALMLSGNVWKLACAPIRTCALSWSKHSPARVAPANRRADRRDDARPHRR